MKIIKVESCGECPKRAWDRAYNDMCSVTKNILTSISTIPDTCPLEDDTDLIPALDLLQEHLEKGAKLSYGSQTKRCALVQDANMIIYGKTIRELLVNLINKEC